MNAYYKKRSHDFTKEPPELMPRDHQNPLRLLELLAKGFCPVITGRMETDHSSPGVAKAEEEEEEPINRVSCSTDDAAISTQPDAVPSKANRNQLCHPERLPKESVSKDRTQQQRNDAQEILFELRERPPSDVMGVSRKIWDGFCSNCHFSHNRNIDVSANKFQQPAAHQHRGFCSVLVGQYHALCLDDKESIPEGEDISVSSLGSLSVDLSPQSPPLSPTANASTVISRSTSSSFDTAIDAATIDAEGDCGEDEGDPLAEFEVTSSHRGMQVLLATILAICLTFAILQQWGSTNHQRLHFTLQPKQLHVNAQAQRGILGIQIARKEDFILRRN